MFSIIRIWSFNNPEILNNVTTLINGKMENNKSKKKQVNVAFDTPYGTKSLTFVPVNDPPLDDLLCNTRCPYGKVCDSLVDPRNPTKFPEFKFIDFCSTIGELLKKDDNNDDEDPLTDNFVPKKGTIERNLTKFPTIHEQLLKQNPWLELKSLILDNCDGWCENYTKDFSKCNIGDPMCFFHRTFMKNPDLLSLIKNKDNKN